MTILRAIVVALAAVVLTAALLVAIVGCSSATTRALCDTSGIVLDTARPASSGGKLAAQVGRFIRGLFCPKVSAPPEG